MKTQNILTFQKRSLIRDIYIPITMETEAGATIVSVGNIEDVLIFTGSATARTMDGPADADFVTWLSELCATASSFVSKQSDFRLEHSGQAYRARRQRTSEGHFLALRKLPDEVPHLRDLRLPSAWKRIVLEDPKWLYGGLVLVTANNGQGKTTSLSSVIRSRLEKYGGICVTAEDPPELPLAGYHGSGRCFQIPVINTKGAGGFAQALFDCLRFYPSTSGGGTMLFVGEIRDPESAAQALQASAWGHLVFATIHGSNVQAALKRIVTLASSFDSMGRHAALEHVADHLKAVFFQRLTINDKDATGDEPLSDLSEWQRGNITGEALVHTPELKKLIVAEDWDAITKASKNQSRILKGLDESASIQQVQDAINPKVRH